MIFNIYIEFTLGICPETGMSFYYNSNCEKIYDIPSIIVPDEYRKILRMVEANHIFLITDDYGA